MKTTVNKEGIIKKLSNRRLEDKAGLWYILRSLNHAGYFYAYIESYSRNEILDILLKEIEDETKLLKLCSFNSYKEFLIIEIEPKDITPNDKYNTKLNYNKLMDYTPFIYEEFKNLLGQNILFVEHPTEGDMYPIIAVFTDFKVAFCTDFYDLSDMTAEHGEYQPAIINNKFQHGIF